MDPRELDWLRRVRDLSQRLGSEEDPAVLPGVILDASLELTGAERALLVAARPPDASGRRKVSILDSVGFTRDDLAGNEGALSRSVIESALEGSGRAVLTTRPRDRELLAVSSLISAGVRSVACLPLRVRGALRGVLYLDHRGSEDLFCERELPTLQTFATQAALSLELLERPRAATEPAAARFLVGESEPLQALLSEVQRVARGDEPVLLCGEEGTELGRVARELHAQGPQARFELLSCAEPPASLARRLLGSPDKPGRLGADLTLCLEGVDQLDPDLQRVLATTLAEGTYTPLWSSARLPLRARLIATTGADLAQRCDQGTFRSDLHYRLDVQRLVVPPLRQRREDLPALCAAWAQREGVPLEVRPGALERMRAYAWPGNLAELESELARLRARGLAVVTAPDLSQRVRDSQGVTLPGADFSGRTLQELREDAIRAALDECKGVKTRAAKKLGISRSTLYHLLARYGIE
ncbi:MAG TPA: hypothetical protein DEA08_18830 [Planctomycetes bacterium]|nr:hypothetical protein [Planctomycetota bacterium]